MYPRAVNSEVKKTLLGPSEFTVDEQQEIDLQKDLLQYQGLKITMKESKLCEEGKEVQKPNSSQGSLEGLTGEEEIFQLTFEK